MTDLPVAATETVDAEALSISAPARNGHLPRTEMPLPATKPRNHAAATAELSVQLDRADRRITVDGELDVASVHVLADVMALLIDLDPGDSTVHVAGVRFIDAAGLGCLVSFANRLAASGAKISVLGASPRLRRLFDLAKLGELFLAS